MPTLYLVDGHAQFFRAYYAIRAGMTSPVTGEPTHLTHGFVGLLLKLIRDCRPDYLAVVIDASGDRGTFRSEIYPEYKAHRPEPPDDFGPQVERCLRLLGRMHVPVIAEEGVEADDVIASLVRRLRRERPDLDIRILSRDKDLAQLVDEHVVLFDMQKEVPITPADVFGVEGVRPEHVVDVLALMGDSVDNVPGVPGIGPKTAADLVLRYGSIEGVYAHIDEIKGKRGAALAAAREQVELSRRLVALREDLPVPFDLGAARCAPESLPLDDLLHDFRELDFNTHARTLRAIVGAPPEAPPERTPAASAAAPRRAPSRGRGGGEADDGGGLFAHLDDRGDGDDAPGAASGPRIDFRTTLVADEAALRALVARLRAAGRCAIDTETDGLRPRDAALCGVSLACDGDEGFYVPVRSPEPDRHLDLETVRSILAPVLADEGVAKLGHNLKFDLQVLRSAGLPVAGPLLDTMVASIVLDATRGSHKLDHLALAHLDHACIPLVELIGSGKAQRTFDQVALDRAVEYAAEDAVVAWRLAAALEPGLDAEPAFRRLFDEVEMPLVRVLADMEWNGIRCDPTELERQRAALRTRIDEIAGAIQAAAPHPFNPESPKQLAAALFNAPDQDPPGLGLKPIKSGKTGPSTDQEVLERLADDPGVTTPIPGLILEHRRLVKLVGTYLDSLAQAISPRTGRIHASFHQGGAATGRLSSSDPNLQNIPIRTEVGREIRRAFLPADGCVLVAADYSQIELRMLAHLAEDPALLAAFHAGADIHRAVAAEVFGVAPEAVTGEQRGAAKMVNFGIVYGITAFGLARRLGGQVTQAEAQGIIDDYKRRFAGLEAFLARCVELARERGWAETILGRRRAIPEVHDRNPARRAFGERIAINSVVQGSAADLIKVAMIDVHHALREHHPEARLLLQIHDELVLEAPAAQGEAVRDLVVRHMEHAMPLRVPLVVDSTIGASWFEAS